jgi:hypothetical protein
LNRRIEALEAEKSTIEESIRSVGFEFEGIQNKRLAGVDGANDRFDCLFIPADSYHIVFGSFHDQLIPINESQPVFTVLISTINGTGFPV